MFPRLRHCGAMEGSFGIRQGDGRGDAVSSEAPLKISSAAGSLAKSMPTGTHRVRQHRNYKVTYAMRGGHLREDFLWTSALVSARCAESRVAGSLFLPWRSNRR